MGHFQAEHMLKIHIFKKLRSLEDSSCLGQISQTILLESSCASANNAIALSGNIQQLLNVFRIHEEYRDYHQFVWYEDNDFERPLMQNRMKAHVFGKTSSSAIATFKLLKHYFSIMIFVNLKVYKTGYVRCILTSFVTESDDVHLIKETEPTLKTTETFVSTKSLKQSECYEIISLRLHRKRFGELNHCAYIFNLLVQHR